MSPRADATRNRARVLDAAHAMFAERGLATSTEEIARRAGVGVGTVFRHFPTKEALFAAVLAVRMDALAAEAERLAADGEAGEGLFEFFADAVAASALKTAFGDALTAAGVDPQETLAPVRGRLTAAVDALLRRAQSAGTVRDDVQLGQVFALLVGASRAAEHLTDPTLRVATVALILDGLRTRR